MLIRASAPKRRRASGFTLIELMVTITLMSILLVLAFPSMSTWVRNSRVRTVSDALQNGLRTAQAEALRLNRQTVFSLTNNTAAPFTAATNGSNWSINTIQLMAGEGSQLVESGVLTNLGTGVQIAGPAAICFNSLGRLFSTVTPGPTGAACSAAPAIYNVSASNVVPGDRPLQLRVEVGGQLRLCDPAKPLSATDPDGCP